MFKKKNNFWELLAAEVAMKIQDLLEPGVDYPPYEYYAEATSVVDKIAKKTDINVLDISKIIAETLTHSLEFTYEVDDFHDIAVFTYDRWKHIKKYV